MKWSSVNDILFWDISGISAKVRVKYWEKLMMTD